jgi:hypothetical protein
VERKGVKEIAYVAKKQVSDGDGGSDDEGGKPTQGGNEEP